MRDDVISDLNFDIIKIGYTKIVRGDTLTPKEKKEIIRLIGRMINLYNLTQLSQDMEINYRIARLEEEINRLKNNL